MAICIGLCQPSSDGTPLAVHQATLPARVGSWVCRTSAAGVTESSFGGKPQPLLRQAHCTGCLQRSPWRQRRRWRRESYRVGAVPGARVTVFTREGAAKTTCVYHNNKAQYIGATFGRKMPRSSTHRVIRTLRSDRSRSRRRPRWHTLTLSFLSNDTQPPARSSP